MTGVIAPPAAFVPHVDGKVCFGRARFRSSRFLRKAKPIVGKERLLFVGNDNDFATRDGMMPDGDYDSGLEHDSRVLAYRVTLPW
ncbi:MAG: hypothetical protein KBA31_05490 [Alphaproteobacteria bacterium]|nr:hypothetical protein [Alphaproteobacteria bacterium]